MNKPLNAQTVGMILVVVVAVAVLGVSVAHNARASVITTNDLVDRILELDDRISYLEAKVAPALPMMTAKPETRFQRLPDTRPADPAELGQ